MKTLAFVPATLVFAAALFAAAPEEFSTSAGTLQIVPIQHASLLLKAGGKVLYVDPAQGTYDGLPPADYILITDIHGDHMVPALVDIDNPGLGLVHRHGGIFLVYLPSVVGACRIFGNFLYVPGLNQVLQRLRGLLFIDGVLLNE